MKISCEKEDFTITLETKKSVPEIYEELSWVLGLMLDTIDKDDWSVFITEAYDDQKS